MKPTCQVCLSIFMLSAVTQIAACSEEPTDFGVEYRQAALDATAASSAPAAKDSTAQDVTADPSLSTNRYVTSAKGPLVVRDGIDPLPEQLQQIPLEQLRLSQVRSTFKAGSLTHSNMRLDLDGMLSEQRIVMTGSTADDVRSFQQVDRPSHFDAFQQGFTGTKEEDFLQTTEPGGVLDVMLVVDNSGSMYEEQTNLSTKLDPLLSYVAASDWRIAINTTDPANGCVTDLIKKGDSNIAQRFADAVNKGVQGSGNERGILQGRAGLEATCLATPWVRANSTVAVLIISDEDNCSNNGAHCPNTDYNTSNYLYNYLNTIRVAGDSARVYGIISHPSRPCSSAASVGTQYADVISRTSGTWGDICDADYTATLSAISQNIASALRSQFALNHTPDTGSLEVYINSVRTMTGFTLTGNVVEFVTAPSAGSTIKFKYRHTSAVHQSFQLSQAAAVGSINVELNGVTTNGFSYNSQNRQVTFDTVPPDSSSIMVRYRANSALTTRFNIGGSVIASSLKVEVNGVRLATGYSYESSSGDLIFTTAPADAAQISVELDRLATAQLIYPLLVAEDSSYMVVDSSTRQPVNHTVIAGNLKFGMGDYRFGRHISVVSNLDQIGSGSMELPFLPVAETLKLSSDLWRCDLQSGLRIENNRMLFDGCDFAAAGPIIQLTFDYWTRHPSPYVIDASQMDATAEIQVWHVWINGEPCKDFKIEQHSVFIKDDDVPSTAEIVVAVEFLRAP